MKKTIIAKVNEVAFKKLVKRKEDKLGADRDWGEFLEFIAKEVKLQPTEGELISQATKENLLALWMSNFADNLPYIRKGNTLDKLVPQQPEQAPKGAGIVIGAGPSIRKYKHLEKLAESSFEGKILACDSALVKCLKKGIIPDITISVDGAEIISKFYEDELVKKYGPQLKVLLITTVHPKVRKAVMQAGAEIYWFHGMFDDWRSLESFTKLMKLTTKTEDKPYGCAALSCLGNAGAALWVVAHSLLRLTPIGLIGIDMGYPDGYPLEKTYYFSTYLQAAGGNAAKALTFGYSRVYNPFFKCTMIQDAIFRHYTEAWRDAAKHTQPWVVTVNCSGESALFSYDGTINCMYFEDFLQHYKDANLKEHFLKAEGE